ncbi:alpha/beta hydrolase [Olivibacter sp. SDN3]|uniref:alpha/beta hydrolase n=1 Tax=Olivibacter sp. SDN3 TaxID=2764720 RepID=UPI00165137E9|nr:alpha/beta hydrolase [Olivibacter sp. SDN3]QNL48851.1 alpha/beta hydrolase [Olivibacter sp. SDN3]
MVIRVILLGVILFGACSQAGKEKQITYEDHFIESTDSVRLFVREFKLDDKTPISPYPLLLVHGGGPGAIASFDLDIPHGSLARDLAAQGIKVYIMDIRGWELSTYPDYDKHDSTIVTGNYEEAFDDIDAVVEFIREKEQIDKVSLFGWATGGHWGGYYATRNSEKVSHFISLNSLYSVNAPWPLRAAFGKEEDTSQFNKSDHFRTSDKVGLVRQWNATIPIEVKNDWRDSLVMEAYRNTATSFHPDSNILYVPGGYQEESFYMSLGKKYWDAADITCPTLIIRSDLDFWSRPSDLVAIEKALVNTERKRIVEIPGTHYVFLDRPEKGRTQLISEIKNFIDNR